MSEEKKKTKQKKTLAFFPIPGLPSILFNKEAITGSDIVHQETHAWKKKKKKHVCKTDTACDKQAYITISGKLLYGINKIINFSDTMEALFNFFYCGKK